ncbi:MAG TPA: phosphate ABC transporter substrate-binding protein PstS [Terriglobales bacterium]|nr:phosphate ABC transporter substrate-binding protein PstS [Terriglobales bacterium]
MRRRLLVLAGTALLFCNPVPTAAAQGALVLVGSGSTVPAPLVAKWTEAYNRRAANVQIRYVTSGTDEGITAMSHGSGDFAMGEVPLTSQQHAKSGLIPIPAVVIGIVPIYNLPGNPADLRFSGEVLAEIFLGRIKNWNSPILKKLNPGIKFPDLAIRVINRPPGKGSNYIFTEYLSKVSPKFRSEVGVSASPKWPVGKPAARSSEMVETVMSQMGAIGYVEAQYAIQSRIPFGLVLNPSGRFVKASSESLAHACRAVETPQFDKFSASLTNAPGEHSFPIASFDWFYLRSDADDAKRMAALEEFLDWVFSDGQRIAADAGYADLPVPLRAKISARLRNMKQKETAHLRSEDGLSHIGN